MPEHKHPSDIAREALKRLAAENLPPTPANFSACYNEIAGLPDLSHFPEPQLRRIAASLGVRGEAQEKQQRVLEAAIALRSWQRVQQALVDLFDLAAEAPSAPEPFATVGLLAPLAQLFAAFIEAVKPALGEENMHMKRVLAELLLLLRAPEVDLAGLQAVMARLACEVQGVAEEQVEIKSGLLKLLQLIVDNIGELSSDDSWFSGQIDGLRRVIARPLNLRNLDEMERCLRDVMLKQGRAKARSMAAQEQMRQMLSAFTGRLADMSESSVGYQEKIEASARRIEQVRSVEELTPLLGEVLDATREMSEVTRQSQTQLESLQERALATEAELAQLHRELDAASMQARHDPLTDALNRKGLDEALNREIAGMQRKDSPLSVSLLDLDNFKKLNDRLGHATGDQALVHLVKVARASLRPADSLARYGGEEFVILMPDTTLEQAVDVMTRLQRELTKAIFLADQEKILITFSAGVAQLGWDEAADSALARADRAMYQAKRAGKNRVTAG